MCGIDLRIGTIKLNALLFEIGSGDGDAIRISEELTRGISSRCSTFNSPPLVEERGFEINEMEVRLR